MSDEKKCPGEELEESLACGNSAQLVETLQALTALVNAICKCGCGGDNGGSPGAGEGDGDGDGPGTGDGDGDGDGPGTGDGDSDSDGDGPGTGDSDGECKGGVGEEYLLDIDMKSDEGAGEFRSIASSLYTNTAGWQHASWRAFQKAKSTNHTDCWAASEKSENPHHLGLLMEENKYVVTKVEYDTRHLGGGHSGTPDLPPKEINLKYLNDKNEWVDLTDIMTIDPQPPANQTFTILVPEDRRVACKGIRLEIYSQHGGYPHTTIARMRVWAKDPCPQDRD